MGNRRFGQLNRVELQNRSRRGFTLPEVLLTVAILVVIFAVTVVGVSKFQQSLRQKELDSKAEIIYMAAQNRITELMASGRSDLYDPDDRKDTETTGDTYAFTAVELTVTPSDAKYSGTAGEADNQNKLYYVTSDNKDTLTTASVLLPADRVDQEIRDNHWVIEYNPKQGTIYAVFYSEKSMDYENNLDDFNSYREKRIRQKETDATIGYYGGDFILETEEVTELIPSVTIYNEEKLYAVIECKAPTDVDQLNLEITIEDSFGNKKTISGTELNLKKIGSESWLCDTLVLDDLTKGNRFKDKYSGLVPGSDITVTCVATANSSMIDQATAKDTDNSLFASVSFNDSSSSTTSETTLTDGTATIKYARHLQNLDENSGVNDNKTLTTNASGKQQQLTITKAVQENNIHFDDDESTDEDWYSLYYKSAPFKSIENDVLMSYSGSFTSGGTSGSCSIHGLNTTGGLFNTFYGTELKDITLTGTTITGGNSSNNAGALCAETTSGTLKVTGCKVYLDSSEGDVSTAKADDNGNMKHWISGSNYVGGLIGHVQNTVTIENSLAATVAGKTTTDNTGGLVGYVASSGSVTINKSYADCYLYGKTVGGLVGGGTNVSITNSYAVGYIYASSKAAGFVPAKIQSASSSYAAMSFEGDLDKVTAYAMTEGYSGTTSKLYYIPFQSSIQHIDGKETSRQSNVDKSVFLAELNGTDTIFTSGTANPYNIKDQGLTADYTYPAINGMVNYGDWRASFQSGKLVYYEKYKDGSYGISGANTSSLKSNATVVGDGYGVVYSAESTDEVTVTYKDKDGNNATGTLAAQVEITITNGNDETSTAYLRALPKEAVNTEYAPSGFYQTVTIGESDVWYYNPHFAKTQMQTEPKSTDAVSEVYVRTARQLKNLSMYYENYYNKTQKSLYTQEIDIDYTTYNWTNYYGEEVTKQDPIGNGDEKIFTSKYNGGSHTISGVSFVNTNGNSFYAGMFGYNQGTLSNIFVVWDYAGDNGTNPTVELSASVTGADKMAYIGVLAGRSKKTITNCGVTGYKISCESTNGSTAYIGGLVGQNDGKITKSYADVPYIFEEPSSSTVKIGGFVGRNEARISYCYASSAIRVTKATESTVEMGGFYGENTSIINYAYCTTAFYRTGGINGYGFGPAGGTLTECYYLTKGTYSYVGNITTYGNLTEGHPSAEAVTKAKDLRNKKIPGFSDAKSSSYHTLTVDKSSEIFPYPAIATDANGEPVHYGNWTTRAELGGVGVFYWEHEINGTNNGYHLSYIGIGDTTKKTSSLCTAHDDGGIIDAYGYGYYIEKNEEEQVVGSATLSMTGFGNSTSTENGDANAGLEEQLDGFEIHAYTTGTGTGQLYLDKDTQNSKGIANGTWTIKYNNNKDGEKTYTFEVCPFFANAFRFSGSSDTSATSTTQVMMTEPGTSGNQYEIRSAAQLQYINWNAYKKNATSDVVSQNDDYNNYFTYLSYLNSRKSSSKDYTYKTEKKEYYWLQSHDVDNNNESFTPIGSLFYNSNADEGEADIAGFTGTYDGGEYMVKNLNISEDRQMIGLFGITIGANLKNIFIYSESGNNVIENKTYTSDDTDNSADYNYRWYCIGGLVGFAAEGTTTAGTAGTDASITNCSVAGYTIKDNRSRNGGWGGASIGGLAGACNMTIERCTAVNDIEINVSWASTDTKNNPDTHKNIRVGGLIGNLRGTVDSCYSGGSITGTEKAKSSYYETSSSSSGETYKNTDTTGAGNPSIWAGGISGGIVMIDYGVSGLIGDTDSVVVIKNSYSYVQMPESGYRLVKSSQSIASIGEMQSTAFDPITEPNAYIFNCYAYEPNVEKTDDYKSKNGSTYWNGESNIHTGNSTSNKLRIYNGSKDPYLTYAQFTADEKNTSGALYLLKNNGSKCSATINNETYTAGTSSFSFVTVSENGMRVDGKYSYPAGENDLKDANYPFPTILTQKKSSTETVNVHYGKWPSGSISWVNGRKLTFDLLDNYDSSLGAATINYLLKATGVPSFSYFDDKGNAIAEGKSNVTATNKDNSSGTYNITVKAIDKGTEYIRAAVGEELNDNDLWVNVTAILDLSATTPQEITLTLPAGGSTEAMPSATIKLSAKSKSGTKDFTSQTAWSFELEDDGEKVVSYNPEAIAVGGTAEVKVTAVGEGSTSLTATASYTIKLNGKDKTFTEPIIIHITVNKPEDSTEGTN